MKNVFLPVVLFILIATLVVSACKNKREGEVIAKIGNENIYQTDVDANIKNSLYELLFGIFKVRTIALENLIEERVLTKESQIMGISVDSMVRSNILKRKQSLQIEQFIKRNSLENGVVDPKQPFRIIPLGTEEGQDILIKAYEGFLKNEYVNELKKKYLVSINLSPPMEPRLDLRGVVFVGRGNEKAKHEVWIISDFTCPSCRQYENVLNAFYKRFKDEVFFKYAHFSGGINTSMIFADCAGEQGKYWEAYSVLYKRNVYTTGDTKALMDSLKLDEKKCIECIERYDSTKVLASMKRLSEQKINATPTIIIDGRTYYGEISLDELSKQLNAAVDKRTI